MPKARPLLILGAGASRPYGFPTASELRSIILGGNKGNRALRDLGVSWQKLFKYLISKPELLKYPAHLSDKFDEAEIPLDFPVAAEFLDVVCRSRLSDPTLIRDLREPFLKSQRVSIDSFIADQGNNVLAETACTIIAAVILLCERVERLDGHWAQQLINAMYRHEEAFAKRGLNIITFNYDRSLEQILRRASYVRNERKPPIFEAIDIEHAYGSLGQVAYGNLDLIRDASRLVGIADGRKTLSEKAREMVSNATKITFLGFGFWPENMAFLDLPKDFDRPMRGSSRGLPNTVKLDLQNTLPTLSLDLNGDDLLDYVLNEPIFDFAR